VRDDAVAAKRSPLLRQRPFGLLFAATLISFLGNGANYIAIFWLVLVLTDSPTALGGLVAVTSVAGIVVPPLAGVIIDRFDRRYVAIGLDVIAAACVGAVPALKALGLLQVWHLYVATFVTASVYAAYKPTVAALIQEIVAGDELVQANSLYVVAVQSAYLTGSSTAGLLVAGLSPETVLALDAATYVASALCMTFLRLGVVPVVLHAAGAPAPARASPWGEFRAGLQFIAARPAVLNVCLLNMFPWVTISVINTLLAPWTRDVLGGSAFSFGIIDGMIALGSILAGVIGAALYRRAGERALFWLGGLFAALATLGFAPARHLALAMALALLMGVSTTVSKVTYQAYLQRAVAREFMGRVISSAVLLGSLLSIVFMFIAGQVAERASIQVAFAVMAGLLGVGVAWAHISARRARDLSGPQVPASGGR